MPKHIVRKCTVAAFFSASQNKGLFLQGKVLYMCYSLFQTDSWEKLEQTMNFLRKDVFLCVFLVYTEQVSLE